MKIFLLVLFILVSYVYADEDRAGLPGFCSVCGVSIADIKEGKMTPTENYRLLECKYTNGQYAKVAVCSEHRYDLDPKFYPVIWDNIKRGWANQMKDWYRERKEKYWKFYEGNSIESCIQ